MKKRERVIAAIRGQEVDVVPSSFSIHFPVEIAYGSKAVTAHLDFQKKTDTDILKIMNENLVPSMGSIRCASEYSRVRFSNQDKFMTDQLTLIKQILDLSEDDCFTVGTLHGVVASAIHPLKGADKSLDYNGARLYLKQLLDEDPVPVVDGMKRIAEGMCNFARESVKLGLDGIYYAALGGERRYFTDEQFARYIEPLDKMILEVIREAGGYSILHICKDGLNMERYRDYGPYCDVVNWGVYEVPFSLQEGRSLFPDKTIMGGLENRSGVLVDGSVEDVRSEVKDLIKENGRKSFILGADCTLATEQDLSKVRAAVDAAREESKR